MKVHKAGRMPVLLVTLILVLLNIPLILFSDNLVAKVCVQMISLLLIILNINFFRKPERRLIPDDLTVLAPADGQVMVAGLVSEKEYFNEERIQVSIFMSVWNVHINWFPVAGTIIYQKYHPGKYLVARLPKSSLENERNTVVLRTREGQEILIRQIAGAVARRIITFGKKDMEVAQGQEMGFIRYGSRVDVLLPVSSRLYVQPGDRVTGCLTHLARIT